MEVPMQTFRVRQLSEKDVRSINKTMVVDLKRQIGKVLCAFERRRGGEPFELLLVGERDFYFMERADG